MCILYKNQCVYLCKNYFKKVVKSVDNVKNVCYYIITARANAHEKKGKRKMKNIVMNTLAKVNKNSTLDEIKAVMREECAKVSFEIADSDWNDMLTDVLYELA